MSVPAQMTREEFDALATSACMRPIICLGRPTEKLPSILKDVTEGQWLAYTNAVPDLAGYWNHDAFSVIASMPMTNTWVEDRLYTVPYEHILARETWFTAAAHGGGGKIEREENEAVIRALGGIPIPVDHRWLWSDNPSAWQRLAVTAYAAQIHNLREMRKRVLVAVGDRI